MKTVTTERRKVPIEKTDTQIGTIMKEVGTKKHIPILKTQIGTMQTKIPMIKIGIITDMSKRKQAIIIKITGESSQNFKKKSYQQQTNKPTNRKEKDQEKQQTDKASARIVLPPTKQKENEKTEKKEKHGKKARKIQKKNTETDVSLEMEIDEAEMHFSDD